MKKTILIITLCVATAFLIGRSALAEEEHHGRAEGRGDFNGSMCGWLNTEDQNKTDLFNKHGFKNLFLAGHWVTEKHGQGGVAMCAYSGKKVVNRILTNLKCR